MYRFAHSQCSDLIGEVLNEIKKSPALVAAQKAKKLAVGQISALKPENLHIQPLDRTSVSDSTPGLDASTMVVFPVPPPPPGAGRDDQPAAAAGPAAAEADGAAAATDADADLEDLPAHPPRMRAGRGGRVVRFNTSDGTLSVYTLLFDADMLTRWQTGAALPHDPFSGATALLKPADAEARAVAKFVERKSSPHRHNLSRRVTPQIRAIASLPDGRVATGENGLIRLWDVDAPKRANGTTETATLECAEHKGAMITRLCTLALSESSPTAFA